MEKDHQDLSDPDKFYRELLSNRKEQQKELQDKIAEAGILHNMQYFAICYGVSVESIKIYWKTNHQYPIVYLSGDTEENIVRELNTIERLLKIKKLKNV